jgi:hypothetical protein
VGDLSNASKVALDAGLHFEALLLSLAQQQLPEGTIVSSIVADYCRKYVSHLPLAPLCTQIVSATYWHCLLVGVQQYAWR